MAVDKGWSWVVLFASFMDLVLCGIFVYTVGVFHVVLLDVFEEDATKTAFVGAVRSSLMALTAPLASFVINTFSCRICAVLGGLLILLGSGLSTLVTTTDQLLLTYGFISGIGTGLAYAPALVVLGFNFKKYLGIAAGISQTGGAFGVLVGGPVVRAILDTYGLKGAHLIMGAIGLHACVFGMLMRPPMLKDQKPSRGEDLTSEKNISRSVALRMKILQSLRPYMQATKNKAFFCHTFSIMIWNMGISTVFLYLPFYAQSKGTSPEAAAALFSGVGILSMGGRILAGMVVNKQEIDGLLLHMGMLGTAAIAMFIFPFCASSYSGQMIFACIFGFYAGGPMALLNTITVEMVGIDNFASAMGIEICLLGVGYLLGPPLAGLIINRTQTYDSTFIFAGMTFLIASTMTLITTLFRRKHVQHVNTDVLGSFSVIPQQNAVRSHDISFDLSDYVKVPNLDSTAHGTDDVLLNERESDNALTCVLLPEDHNSPGSNMISNDYSHSEKNNTRETETPTLATSRI